MKNFYIFGGAAFVGLVAVGLNRTIVNYDSIPSISITPQRTIALASDQLTELVYLPDNTCRFTGDFDADIGDYREIVKSCLDMRHREMRIEPIYMH
mgnify:FL=1